MLVPSANLKFLFTVIINKLFLLLACVASDSNAVIARKLEREQKKGWIPLPSPVIPIKKKKKKLLFQLSRRTREETLDTQATLLLTTLMTLARLNLCA